MTKLNNIYESIPDCIDRAVDKVLAKYEWDNAPNPYRGFTFEYRCWELEKDREELISNLRNEVNSLILSDEKAFWVACD